MSTCTNPEISRPTDAPTPDTKTLSQGLAERLPGIGRCARILRQPCHLVSIGEIVGKDAKPHGEGRQRLLAQKVLVMKLDQIIEVGAVGEVVIDLDRRPVSHVPPFAHQPQAVFQKVLKIKRPIPELAIALSGFPLHLSGGQPSCTLGLANLKALRPQNGLKIAQIPPSGFNT